MKDEYHCNQFYHTNHTLQEASLDLQEALSPYAICFRVKNPVGLGLAQILIGYRNMISTVAQSILCSVAKESNVACDASFTNVVAVPSLTQR